MGLREEKKEETRRTILNKAGELFLSKGYPSVTTMEIARAAGIAEGTLFNYFRNKGDLFIAAMMPEPTAEMLQSPVLDQMSPIHLTAAIVDMLDNYLSSFGRLDKRILQDYFTIVYSGGLKDGAEARAGLFASDDRILNQVTGFLITQKTAHFSQLAALDVDLAAACIFGCTISLISQYVLLEEWTYQQFKQSMHDQILFIIKGHVI